MEKLGVMMIKVGARFPRLFRHCAEFKAVTDESLDLKEVVCYRSHCESQP